MRDSVSDINSFPCEICGKVFTTKQNFQQHYGSCVSQPGYVKLKELSIQLQAFLHDKDKQLADKDLLIDKLRFDLQQVTLEAVKRPTNVTNHTHEYDNEYESDNEAVIEIEAPEPEYHLTPLNVGDGYIIENREEDNYINVTNLCKAGGKEFKAWNRLERTKAFLQVLSSSVLIHTVELIKYNIGGNGERHTWVHPQVAINIAQWISPHFDVKVSSWVYEVMMTGKVDISNTKSYKQLQSENKDKQLKINMLTKKYVKKVPRIQYTESNVIYIVTTARLKKDNIYILGKATNLTSRLSTYNKTDEHEVVYYQQCKDENTMGIIENMIFGKLDLYRESANRERFVLRKDMNIDLFINTIKDCIAFFI
jgi:hypothetical protein